ncbi:hypothetical protein [Pseudomonas sp. TWP3-1]|uniref:hypothetical protein n=1 Tax=Pseudomonas sp. TWP3-1 TaxID=2804631 RepID=UPI003CFA11F8
MSNIIPNGDFETGDFSFWTLRVFQGKADVVNHNRSFQARVQPGVDNGVLLFNKFDAPPGPCDMTFIASAPTAQNFKPPFNYATHPFLAYFVEAYDANGLWLSMDIGLAQLQPTETLFRYSGTMPAGTAKVEVRFSGPSDPDGSKGPLYIDHVTYTPR